MLRSEATKTCGECDERVVDSPANVDAGLLAGWMVLKGNQHEGDVSGEPPLISVLEIWVMILARA